MMHEGFHHYSGISLTILGMFLFLLVYLAVLSLTFLRRGQKATLKERALLPFMTEDRDNE